MLPARCRRAARRSEPRTPSTIPREGCTKTGRERIVPLSATALDALRRQRALQNADKLAAKHGYYEDRGLVFADAHGRPALDAPTKAFADAAHRLGFDGITLHSCRHFVATQAIANGRDVRSVAALLGHTTPMMTLNTYGHVAPGGQERVVASVEVSLLAAQARRSNGTNEAG